ncbi:MAG: dihydrofolate reductase family protein [Burkholderiales bacterium]|nr:dihydrofolate reductase family protein [Burkholderiales bacterium]
MTVHRPVRLFIATSLDGCIARADGRVDWLFTDGDYGYAAFYDAVDTVIMGRRTYDDVLGSGPYPYPGKAGFVFSHSPPAAAPEHVTFVSGPPAALVARLREAQGKALWLVGGAGLVASFLDADLVDEIIVSVHPRILGAGIPLFPRQGRELALELAGVTPFPSGLVQLRYARRR